MKNAEFAKIYTKYRSFSIDIARAMVKDHAVAEDITQDTFYSLYRMGEKLDISDERKLGALIKTITINKAKDYFKRSAHKMEIAGVDDSAEEVEDKHHNVEAQMLHMEEKEYLRLVLQRLRDENPMNYEIFIRVKWLGIPPEFVAKEFEISTNNVNNRIMRTKHWVKKEMSRLYED